VKKNFFNNMVILLLIFGWTVMPAASQAPLFAELNSSGNSRNVGELWNRTELFFGTSKPDGTVVTDQEFKRFLDEVVTPRFPDGLTLLAGFGQFRNSHGNIIQERSMLLILLYPLSTRDSGRKIEEIRTAYTRAFQQESVLRVDSLGKVSF